MLVTPSGIVMLVRLLQSSNASFPILVTLSGIVYSVTPPPIANELSVPSIIKHLPSSDAYLPLNPVRLLQLLKALFPIEVTILGKVTLVRLSQF